MLRLVLIGCALTVTLVSAASAQRLPLWNGRAPVGDGQFEQADSWITVHRAPGDKPSPAIVICPGGGYGTLVSGPEGHGIAKWLNGHGFTGVVLEYRLPAGRPYVPLLDAQRAIRTVRARAADWNIDPQEVGIMGFSAGGHLASTAATHFDAGDLQAKDEVSRASCRPDFAILIYPVITMGQETHGGSRTNLLGKNPSDALVALFSNERQVTDDTPPTFLAHARDDKVVSIENSRAFYRALQQHNVRSELLELPSGGHGLNGYQGPMWDAWQKRVISWLSKESMPLNVSAARTVFEAPPREYSSAPLWVWNDMLTEQEIRGTMRDLASQKVKQVFVHPRPGLMTPYLSNEWFRLWKIALDEAEQLDMNVWIYDENSYPSGFAGGIVPEIMPESRGRGLVFRKANRPAVGPETLGIYRIESSGVKNVTDQVSGGQAVPEGEYLVASVARARNSPWHGDRCYVDLMYPGVTEKFLEVTLDAYKKHVGDQFGKRVLGSFTDEPNVRPAGGLPWTDHLPQEFEKRWGYSLLDHLPSLTQPVGDWKQVRHDYFQVVLDQFIEHWGKPYYEWCDKNGIAFTGHYWDHEWPNCVGVTDNMAMSAWQHIPGIDCLMNQYREDTHAQFGNVRFVKEVHSLCNQLGRRRFLCEAYGAGGWDLRFEDMKRIADWLGVLGVNLFDEHLSYITLRGARKADHPQSFSYHEPWWPRYHVMAQYVTRLSAAMSMGREENHILVIEPTTTAWMYQGVSEPADRLNGIGNTFFDLLMEFAQAQVQYDVGCEDVMARHGSVITNGEPALVIGQAAYHTVVLPPLTETLRSETMKLLEQFVAAGGDVIACGEPPALINGRPSDRAAQLARAECWKRVPPADAVKLLTPTLECDQFAIKRAPEDKGILFHQRRELADGALLLLVNTSITDAARGDLQAQAAGVQQWDLFTGATCDYPFEKDKQGVQLHFELPPCGSLLLVLTDEATQRGADRPVNRFVPVASDSPLSIRRNAPNVLVLDYCDIVAGGEKRESLYYYHANQFAWQQNGLPRNPWNSAVQFRDELISRKFPAESGFEVIYRFTIDGPVPNPLHLVIERPDLYEITCNSMPIDAEKGKWWLDKSFGKLDISAIAHPGENTVTLRAQPFTMYHEIAAAYVLGDFSLRPVSRGFTVVAPKPLTIKEGLAHATDIEGIAWLTTGIGYHRDPATQEGNDGAPSVCFDLGKTVDLGMIEIWNYNESGLPGRGVRGLRIDGSIEPDGPDAWSIPLGTFELTRSPGGPVGTRTDFAQQLAIDGKKVRYVKFTILSNQNDVSFPTKDGSQDNAFVGLSEVRFHGVDHAGHLALVENVAIHWVSSELSGARGHDRAAVHLVDGSGLGKASLGWNQQGMPFYAHGVVYEQAYRINEPAAKHYKVRVPNWNGSVADVVVNGKLCGHLVSQPWEVDVSNAIQTGENKIEVIVVGTLKNTLGPYHNGPTAGSAWPGMFQRGPEPGPPPGKSYDTIGYGLFEPFLLLSAGNP